MKDPIIKASDILAQLQPIDKPIGEAVDRVPTVQDVMESLVKIAANVGKTSFRISQSAELTNERISELATNIGTQIQSQEDALRRDRERIGILEDEVSALTSAMMTMLDLAAAATRAERPGEDGVRDLHFELVRAAKRAALEPTAIVGFEFDPEVHEAVDERDDTDIKKNHIIQVVRQGYVVKGSVVRLARVIVAV